MEESNLVEYIKIIIDELKQKIAFIFFSFVIVAAVGSFFIFNNQTEFKGQISIKKITNSEFEDLRQINQLLLTAQRSTYNFQTDIPKANQPDSVIIQNELVDYDQYLEFKRLMEANVYEIDQEKLQNIFVDELTDNEELIEVLDELKIIEKSNFDSEQEYFESLRKISNKLEVSKPVISERDKKVMGRSYQEDYILSFHGSSKKIISQIFERTLGKVTDNALKNINNQIKLIVSKLKQEKQFSIEDATMNINNAKASYKMESEKKLKLLQEQAKIARLLNIESNTIGMTENILNSKSTILTTIYEEQLYYLLGYKAIEGEIDLINNRTDEDINKLTPDIIALDSQLRDIKQDRSINRFEERYLNSDLYSQKISLVNYDPLNIRYQQLHSSSFKIIIVSLLFFIGLSAIIIILSLLIKAIRE